MYKSILALISIVSFSVNSYSQKIPERRYYYNFQQKKLFSDAGYSTQEFAPIKYKAGRDINIEIKHFNPLAYEIKIDESNSNYFLSDTTKWSSRIIIPSIPNASGAQVPDPAKTVQTNTTHIFESMDIKVKKIRLESVQTSCDHLKDWMIRLDEEKENMLESLAEYKELVINIEGINNSYQTLKELPELTTDIVSDELLKSFIIPFNLYLDNHSSDSITTVPSRVSSGDLEAKESEFYQRVFDNFQELEGIKNSVDKLKDNKCTGYIELYKEFRNNYDLINKTFHDFTSGRTEHLPVFKNTAALYNKLKKYTITLPVMVTSAITIEKDLHTIEVKTVKGTDQPVIYDNIHVQPARGIKIDVATGFFFSSLSDQSFFKHSIDSIHHKNYLVNGIIKDTIVQESYTAIYKKDNDRISFGGMIFLQAHSQNPDIFNFGGYIGFGALFNDQARWCGSFGGSLLIGRKQRFNINLGLIISQLERLSPPYTINTSYRETIDNIPTYRAWKTGFVVGFSWNL